MKKIVVKLVECGFSFEYENHNSSGESVSVYGIDLVIENIQGSLIWSFENEDETYNESESVYDSFCAKIEQIMIDETSSF